MFVYNSPLRIAAFVNSVSRPLWSSDKDTTVRADFEVTSNLAHLSMRVRHG